MTFDFLHALLARCDPFRDRACLTLTAIHPDGGRPTPSRHVPLHDTYRLLDALHRLHLANQLGWGAFLAVALRRPGLTRYRRGGERDLLVLPALFVDLDDPSSQALTRLQTLRPAPSSITSTGGGFHAYWWLDEPLSDMGLARRLLRALQHAAGGDPMSPAQCLRLVGTRNTKPDRYYALCRIVELHDTYHPIAAFAPLLTPLATHPPTASARHSPSRHPASYTLNPALIQAVCAHLIRLGCVPRGDWLSGPCPYPTHHHHGDRHPSFGFNSRTGYGHCFRCGSILLKDLCAVFSIPPAHYGGLLISERISS